MNVQAVIQRELRVTSRRRETWILRLAFGGGAILAFGFGMLLPHITPGERGEVALVCLSICGFGLSLFAGCYLTADAVTSEKTNSTLGLLLLTPLSGWEIILGKALIHSLQIAYAWLAVIPFFFLPQLLGGITWNEILRIVLAILVTLLLSLALGLFCSTVAEEPRGAVLATGTGMVLIVAVPWLWMLFQLLASRPSPHPGIIQTLSPLTALSFAFEASFRTGALPGARRYSGPAFYWSSILIQLGYSVVLIMISGWLLPRTIHQGQLRGRPSPEQVPARRTLPWLRSQAPLLWLASRGLQEPGWWRALRVLLLLFFGAMLVAAVTTKHWRAAFTSAFCSAYVLHLATRIQLALTATRRWQEDRSSGALETVLATAVTDDDLLQAHHGSILGAFMKPLFILLGVNASLQFAALLFRQELHIESNDLALFSVFFTGGALITAADFAALRWLCLRESLRRAHQLRAAGWALGILMAGSWAGLAVAFLFALNLRTAQAAAGVFAIWTLFCLCYDAAVIQTCRQWMQAGFRARAVEATPTRRTAF